MTPEREKMLEIYRHATELARSLNHLYGMTAKTPLGDMLIGYCAGLAEHAKMVVSRLDRAGFAEACAAADAAGAKKRSKR